MKTIYSSAFACLCSALLMTFALSANDISDEFENVVRTPVGDAPNTLSEQVQQRLDAGEEAAHKAAKEASETAKEELFAKPLYETTHPAAFQRLYHVSYHTGKIELADRSIWDISPGHSLARWATSDYVTISPSGFADYPFCLTNQRRNEFVYAQLYLGPDVNNQYSMKIKSIYIDANGLTNIKLKDGLGHYSYWIMSGADYATLAYWGREEPVIVGLNTNAFAEGRNILINVKRLNFASGNCVEY